MYAGPDLAPYCNGLIDTGLCRLSTVDSILPDIPPSHGSIATHVRQSKFGRAVIQKLSENPRLRDSAAPTLHHADLHKRNIFVADDDPTIITGFTDWQSSSIEPAFEYAGVIPDFVPPEPHLSSKDQPADINAELCRRAFEACLQALVPRLSAANALDDDLLRPFRHCHRIWRDGAVAFTQELIDISNRWKELGLPNSCPYPLPTSGGLVVYQKDYEAFTTALGLEQKLIDLLDTTPDGWVPNHLWEATKAAHREAFETTVHAFENAETIDDQSMSVEELKKIWPFDIEL